MGRGSEREKRVRERKIRTKRKEMQREIEVEGEKNQEKVKRTGREIIIQREHFQKYLLYRNIYRTNLGLQILSFLKQKPKIIHDFVLLLSCEQTFEST